MSTQNFMFSMLILLCGFVLGSVGALGLPILVLVILGGVTGYASVLFTKDLPLSFALDVGFCAFLWLGGTIW